MTFYNDENGVLHIGDQPPPTPVENTKTIRLQDNTNLPSGTTPSNHEYYYEQDSKKFKNDMNKILRDIKTDEIKGQINEIEEKCRHYNVREYKTKRCAENIKFLKDQKRAIRKNPNLDVPEPSVTRDKKRVIKKREKEDISETIKRQEEEQRERRFKNIKKIAPYTYQDQYGDRYNRHGDGFIDPKSGKILPKGTYKYGD